MSKSIFEQETIKTLTFNNLSATEKQHARDKVLDKIFFQLTNKENRYIFYCPDIMVINNLTKLIYETAYEVQTLGYNVLILHEINGFKCKWLVNEPEYEHLKDIPVDYVIKKKSAKSKRTKANYSFQPADTLIVPDQFQEMLDNLMNLKTIQKIVLVSSYVGISALQPGMDYNSIGVEKLLFTDAKLQEDYKVLFNFESALIDKTPINTELFNKSIRKPNEIFPNICISNIGNTDLTQEVINVFYNKYPQLRTFTFKIIPRDNFQFYLDTLKHSALFLILDKHLGSSQMVLEALATGIPVATFKRRELSDVLNDNIVFGTDAFTIADSMAEFCQAWLNVSTKQIDNSIYGLLEQVGMEKYSYESYSEQIHEVVKVLQDNRVRYFSGIQQSMQKEKQLV